jgi:hypothetical protein
MWRIGLLVIHLSPHPRAPAHPSTPEVLQAKERTPTLYPSVVFTFGLVIEFIKVLGVCVTYYASINNLKFTQFIWEEKPKFHCENLYISYLI